MPWDRLWESITQEADKLHLRRISLNIDLWTIDEVYHASWSQGSEESTDPEWTVKLPLFVKSGQIGQLKVVGARNGVPMCDQLEMLLELVGSFEDEFHAWCQPQEQTPFSLPQPIRRDLPSVVGSSAR